MARRPSLCLSRLQSAGLREAASCCAPCPGRHNRPGTHSQARPCKMRLRSARVDSAKGAYILVAPEHDQPRSSTWIGRRTGGSARSHTPLPEVRGGTVPGGCSARTCRRPRLTPRQVLLVPDRARCGSAPQAVPPHQSGGPASMSMTRREIARAMTVAVGGASLAGATLGASPASATERGGHRRAVNTADKYGPVVKHTGKRPTGYEVTFRYYAPSAKRVQLKGEWYFERPSELSRRLTGPDHLVETPGLLPTQWQPGDVPISHPNSTSPNWPVVDMLKGRDGMWTYTTPLPS